MKHKLFLLSLVLLSIGFLSCSEGPINRLTLQNMAAGDVFLNFRGEKVDVPAGSTVEFEEIQAGEYEYETIYSIPAGATSFDAEGEMSGTFKLRAGTKILVTYTSVLDAEGSYTIYASVVSSDNLDWDDGRNPISP